MNNKRTYKSSDARYAINQIVKAYKNQQMNDPRVADQLEVIWHFASRCRMWPILNRVQAVMDILMGQSSAPANALWSSLSFLKLQIDGIHEKNRIMDVRESSARSRFFDRKGQAQPAAEDAPEQLKMYDVVKIPTQGGFHYSIVAEVKDDYVSCFPTTTASRRDLENMGCRSLSLTESGLERFRGIRLTSSEVKIPVDVARKSYKGSVADNDFIKNALSRMMAIA